MRYAIDYAGHGYPLVPTISDTIGRVEKLFRNEWTTSAQIYLRGEESQNRARCSPTPIWPVPSGASSKRPSREARIATSR